MGKTGGPNSHFPRTIQGTRQGNNKRIRLKEQHRGGGKSAAENWEGGGKRGGGGNDGGKKGGGIRGGEQSRGGGRWEGGEILSREATTED